MLEHHRQVAFQLRALDKQRPVVEKALSERHFDNLHRRRLIELYVLDMNRTYPVAEATDKLAAERRGVVVVVDCVHQIAEVGVYREPSRATSESSAACDFAVCGYMNGIHSNAKRVRCGFTASIIRRAVSTTSR